MEVVSLAIETSCRAGGVALGIGERLAEVRDFDASSRHATTLVVRLRELLAAHGLKPPDVNEVYVSVGPGSFTGVRVGVTVARTLAQAVPGLQTVAVPTTHAVAENARSLPWDHLAVVLDAKEDIVYAQQFGRDDSGPIPDGQPAVLTVAELLETCPRPITLIGEGLGYHTIAGEGITQVPPGLNLPTAEGVWRVGRRLASRDGYTEYHRLLPIYARKSEAERLWDARQSGQP